ncbi:ATP-binding Cassette (ABC) Superfamily, partial [Thraustotheca clavata]
FRVLAPLYLKKATDELVLAHTLPTHAITVYIVLLFLSNALSHLKTFLYLKVMQNAYNEVSVKVFSHLHEMSMQFRLTKKTGKVTRCMDRGIHILFFELGPTIFEVIAVSLFFLFAFHDKLLFVIRGISVVIYVIATIWGTQIRMRFNMASNKHDNDANDKAIDSLINSETVKYFCSENYEVDRYSSAVDQFQSSDFSPEV